MGNIGFIFQKDAVMKYRLTPRECILIDWLIWFMDSGYQDGLDRPEGRYYWVKYNKLINDLGDSLGIHNLVSAANILNSLCSKGVLLKLDSGTGHIRKLYFRFTKDVRDELRNGVKTMEKLLEIPVDGLESINPKVLELLSEISKLESEPGKKLFSFIHPEKSRKITKMVKRFNRQMLDIYFGKFTYSKYRLSIKFLSKNAHLIDDNENLKIIEDCKGNWEKISEMVIDAANTYTMWFRPNREPFGKDWLPRDIATWIYDDRNEASIFMACLVKPPSLIATKLSRDVIEKLPENVYKVALRLKRDFFPKIDTKQTDFYWFGVNDVLKAERKLKKIYPDNYMISLWLDYSEEGNWTCEYLKWVRSCWGENTKEMLLPRHIGVKAKPWKLWFDSEENLKDYADELYQNSLGEASDRPYTDF